MEKLKSPIPSSFRRSFSQKEGEISISLPLYDGNKKANVGETESALFYALAAARQVGIAPKSISCTSDNNQSVLGRLSRQAQYFNLPVSGLPPRPSAVLPDRWKDGIERAWQSREFAIEVRSILDRQLPELRGKLGVYRSVMEYGDYFSIRHCGLEIGRFSTSSKTFSVRNRQVLNYEGTNFHEWALKVDQARSHAGGKLFSTYEEHYLESKMLTLLDQGMDLKGLEGVASSFPVRLQFPVSHPGTKEIGFIDAGLPKVGSVPVLFELKVTTSASRGQYVFEALGQALSYYSYWSELANFYQDWFVQLGLPTEWDKGIIAIVVNELGTDQHAKNMRDLFEFVGRYTNVEIRLIEVSGDFWKKYRHVEIVSETFTEKRVGLV